jgi:hypothetical protein
MPGGKIPDAKLFWNKSSTGSAPSGMKPADPFTLCTVDVGNAGSLTSGKVATGPVMVDDTGTTVQLSSGSSSGRVGRSARTAASASACSPSGAMQTAGSAIAADHRLVGKQTVSGHLSRCVPVPQRHDRARQTTSGKD